LTKVGIRVDASKALARMSNLREERPKELDDAAEEMMHEAESNTVDALRQNDSVASQTGIRSLNVRKDGIAEYSLLGRSYLHLLETGTRPHTPEVTRRLEIWAEQEGWAIPDIVEHIEEHGTEAQEPPWTDIAYDHFVKTIPQKVSAHVRREIKF